ncbi:MAG: N-acetyl-gamma-glutamyl-phosphate reductase [Flavobacteriaceae bacterium]|jgi:N-acetyl-gamma-glutamyl-phosphate reductase|nr:N-acetyl-gamma-glutamyl-phosphate reductase [Flavobacteriaceae bacterium]|tara:strand:- start:364 stop:1341 length:978 start_codon:yes stop_codon:yes gene_type:complete
MIKIGIIGGAGYTAGELIRLLLKHPEANIDFIYSTSSSGQLVSAIHQDLVGETALQFSNKINSKIDLLFLCLGHGNSKQFLKNNPVPSTVKIIDLSNDFRLMADSDFNARTFTYGLTELNKKQIIKAQNIANPGCFATAIQLALLPLAANGLLYNAVHINAVTGATGAGTKPSATTHFTWRDNNFSHYKAFSHQHLDEITESIQSLQTDFSQDLNFIPNRGNFSRGIFATSYLEIDECLEAIQSLYKSYYKDAPFTIISENEVHLKQVVNTNKCLIHLSKYKNKLLISSVIDNLLKGASGQAVENMNLMFGLDQAMGLQLKANYF